MEEAEVFWTPGRDDIVPPLLLADRMDIVKVHKVPNLLSKGLHVDISYSNYVVN